MEALASFLGRISNYNLPTNLIPGAILCVLLKYLVGYDFMTVGALELLVIFYFVGMVNGRIGSLIVEWFLKKVHFVTFREHKLFVAAEQKDKKIVPLTETNNMYRSIISVAFTAIVIKLSHFRPVISFCSSKNYGTWLSKAVVNALKQVNSLVYSTNAHGSMVHNSIEDREGYITAKPL